MKINKLFSIGITVFASIVLIALIIGNGNYLIGNNELTIEYTSEYKETGAVFLKWFCKQNYVMTSNLEYKVGQYEVKYIASNGDSLTRKVNVVDNKAPVIDILSTEVDYSENPIIEFVAYDQYDGDLTANVKVGFSNLTLGVNEFTFTVTDSSNNETTVKKDLVVVDKSAPIISTATGEYTFCILNDEIDLSYSAFDVVDGDVTNKVIVESDFDNSKEGIYHIVYSVEDVHKNKTTLTTTINVQPANEKGIPILMYHNFYDDEAGERYGSYSRNWFALSNLKQQLQYVSDNNYYYPSWQQLNDYLDGKIQLPAKSVIFTSDDSNQCVFTNALPLFQQYEIPLTSFVIGNKHIGENYIGQPYLVLQCHTYSLHKNLGTKTDEIWASTIASKQECIDDFSKCIELIQSDNWVYCYPSGLTGGNQIEAIEELGFKMAVTTMGGRAKVGMNKYHLPRQRISRKTELKKFIRMIS